MNYSAPRVRLRGHHLICLHFFHGEGYHPEFIANLDKILQLARTGSEVELCEGPDQICIMCPYLRNRRCFSGENAEQEIREMDETAALLLGMRHADIVTWETLKSRIPRIFGRWADTYCGDCNWRKACEKTRLFRQLCSLS